MLHIRCSKIVAFILLIQLGIGASCLAQRGELNRPDHDRKFFSQGLTFSYIKQRFKSTQHPTFFENDSMFSAEPLTTGGFSVGYLSNFRLNRRFEFRLNPQLVFGEKVISYHLKYPLSTSDETEFMTKSVESLIASFPAQIKLNSDRIGNFSFYVFGGGKLDFNVMSNAQKTNAQDVVKIDNTELGIEAGVGFQFFWKYVIFTPEIKISNGLNNVHFRDATLKFSNVIDQLQTRMIMFSIHIQ